MSMLGWIIWAIIMLVGNMFLAGTSWDNTIEWILGFNASMIGFFVVVTLLIPYINKRIKNRSETF